MSFESRTEDRENDSADRHVVRQIAPGPWADNRQPNDK